MATIEELEKELERIKRIKKEREIRARNIEQSKREMKAIGVRRAMLEMSIKKEIQESKYPRFGIFKKRVAQAGATGFKALKLIAEDLAEKRRESERREAHMRMLIAKKRKSSKKKIVRRKIIKKKLIRRRRR